MKIIQIVKKLNNTEIGKSGTHETYVHVPQELEINDFFSEIDKNEEFIFKKNRVTYQIRCTIGREKRIVGLGDFYRDNDVCAGDEIVFEKCIFANNNIKFYIDLNKQSDILMVQRCKNGFEILNEDRLPYIDPNVSVYSLGEYRSLKIEFISSEKKRANSPKKIDIYDIKIGDKSIINSYNKRDMIEIQFNNETSVASMICVHTWKKYVFKMEE